MSATTMSPTAVLEKTRKLPSAGISVFESRPSDASRIRGGIILMQEIFGVNSHIRAVARRFAEVGYVVWAPAYFDRVETGIELTYQGDDFKTGRDLVGKLGWDTPVKDTGEAARELKNSLPVGRQKVAAIGYCWGGSLAFLASSRLSEVVDAAVGYYGGQIDGFKDDQPRTPLILHFGKKDSHIPPEKTEQIANRYPTVPVYLYDAGHGFNCEMRADYEPAAAHLALERTLDLLAKNLA